MASRFEQQQPSRNSGFFRSVARPQHVGCRLKDDEKPKEKPTRRRPEEARSWSPDEVDG
jgi:hypothetical protein